MASIETIPLGHKTLSLADVAPPKSLAYSPNLYHWLRQHAHFYRDGGVAETVFRVKPGTVTTDLFGEGTLLIGYPLHGHPGDTDFAGVRLMQALCHGSKAGKWCYAQIAPDLIEVAHFWDQYLRVGRCAIDPTHTGVSFQDVRYRVQGDVRTCLWCGAEQNRVVKPRVVVDESWED